MPGSCAGLIRLIRRRVVLGLIFALSLTYCAFSLFRNEQKNSSSLDIDLDDIDPMMLNDNNEDLMPDDNMLPEELRVSSKLLLWQVEIPDRADNMDMVNLNDNNASTQPCRNSVQGKGLIVDERGIVCSRHEVLPNGCCTTEQKQASKNEETLAKRERYSCKTCNSRGCCTIYEYCVSCCLHPDKQILQMKGRKSGSARRQKDGGKLRIRNSDRFQICLAACRTSSSSVQHENTYKDPLAKHCYVPQPLNSQRQRRNFNSLNNNGDSPAVVVTSSSVVMLFTHLSPECYISYCPLNESYVDFSSYINIIYIEAMLTLSPIIIPVLKYNNLNSKCLKRRLKTAYEHGFEAPYICVRHIYVGIFFPRIFQDLISDGVLNRFVLLQKKKRNLLQFFAMVNLHSLSVYIHRL